MCLRSKRFYLFLISILAYCSFNAQTLYWVGGNGNFNDPHHWSLSPGGLPANIIPNASSNLVFSPTNSSGEIKVIFNASTEINWLTINSYDRIRFIHNVPGIRLKIRGGLENLADNKNFNSEIILEFRNSAQSNPGIINTGSSVLDGDLIVSSGNWKVVQLRLDDKNSLYVNKAAVNFYKSVVEVGNLDLTDCASLDFYHTILKVRGETKVKNCKSVSFKRAFLNRKFYDDTRPNDNIYSIAGRASSQNQTSSLCISTPTVQPATCSPGCDGNVIITLPPFNCYSPAASTAYNIIVDGTSCPGSPSSLLGVGPGTYTLTNFCGCPTPYIFYIQDANGDLESISALVPLPAIFTNISSGGTSTILCNGACTGSVNLNYNNVGGNSAPYTFTVFPPTLPSFTSTSTGSLQVTNLCAGTLTVLAKDNINCTHTFIRNFIQPAALNTNSVLSNIRCNGPCTGSLTISPTGGVANYVVNFNPGGTFTLTSGGTATTSGLCTGPVSATLTDSRSCSVTVSALITQPPAITLTVNQKSLTCAGVCDGASTVTAVGGVGPYTITLNPAVGSPTVTNSVSGIVTTTNLCGGQYTATVRDFNNCTVSQTFSIAAPPAVTVTPTFTHVTCFAGSNGAIRIIPTGGNGGPYSFTWSPAPAFGQGTATITGLTSNIYTVNISYGSSCTASLAIPINQPPQATLTVASQTISCFGTCNGGATVTALGGNGGFTYNWNPPPPAGQGTATLSSLCGNTSFTATVSDASLCVYPNVVVSVTQASSITPNITASNITCGAICNGSITASPTGTATFNYTLASTSSTITTAPPYTGLCAGSYTVFMRDLSTSCTQSSVTAVLAPNPLLGTLATTSLTCFNQCNGSVAGSASGGTPGYTLSIATSTGIVPGSLLTGLCAGTYTLHIIDANGCTNNTVVATVTQPTADISISIVSTSMSCSSVNDGALAATVTGGTPGYTLAWSNGTGANPNINLGAATYTLVVTDANSCTKSATAAVISPTAISLSQATTAVSCAGGSNGSATITATGGIPTYTFQFNNVPPTVNTTGIVSGLPQGNYIANVTDFNGCSQSITFTISAPAVLSAAITGTQNSCNVCIGAATVQAAGGNPPYSYAWTNSLSASVGTGSVATGLCPGNYTVVVTAGLCTVSQTVNIAQVVNIGLAVGGTSIQCFGLCTGSAVAVPSGGVGPYTFSWSPTSQITATATNLCAGVHNVTVTDVVGCKNSGTVNILQPAALVAATSKTNATCNGTCNGNITSTVTGGTGAINYTWTPGGNTPNLINVCAGNYSLVIRDANNCTVAVPAVTITQNAPINITFTSSPSACAANNGSVCATVSGGSGSGYTYSWSPVAGAASCLTSLSAGNYTLTGGDGAGCTNSIVALVTNPTGPSMTVAATPVNCFGGNNGSATVTASGVAPFSFTWTPAVTFSTVGTASTSASGLVTGTYIVTGRDGNSCLTSQTVGITQPSSVTANQVISNVKCNGGNTGTIALVPSGGTPPYTFNWSPPGLTGAGTGTVTGLVTGTYAVVIGGAVPSCTTAFTFSVSQPPPLSILTTASNVKCNGACSGSIVANASGGTGAISYNWLAVGTFTGASTATIFNLCPAIYTLIVTDANLCTISTTVQISEPPALTSTLILLNATCSNSCNAIATHSVVGGVPGYTFSWSSSAVTSSVVNNLCGGNYTGTAMDANGCLISKGFTVTPPPPFALSLVPSNPLCNAICNGSIATTLSGAQGTVAFNWSPVGSGQNPTGLCFNNYTVVATDANSCVATGVTSLVNPPALLANISTTNASCAAACNGFVSITPSNAVGAVTYVYTPPIGTLPNLTNVCSGNYSVQLTDANGCQASGTFTLIDPPPINVNPSTIPSTCTFSNGSISVVVIGGTPGYTYTWQAPVVSTSSVASNLPAGLYTLVVTDSKNCTNTVSIPLSNSNGPSSAPITFTNVNCNGQSTGAASVNVAGITGGTPGYVVSWLSPPAPATLNPITGLSAGGYTAQITDANNCVLFAGVTISEPPAVLINPTFGLPTCNGTCDGSVALNPTGGVGPTFSYTWFPAGPNGPTLINACAGLYSIFIGDNGNSCIYTQTVNLPAQLNISATTSITPNQCFGDCNATATAFNVAGGVPPYTFNWSNGQVGPVATNLCNGLHSVIITDANGCFNTFNVNVSSGSPITSTVSITSPSCNLCNGGANITASGGSGAFTFLWTTGSTLTTLSGLCAGVYQVLITDQTIGCTKTETVIINNSNGITGENFNIKNLSCLGTCDGGATVTAIGGTAPITYNWILPATSNSVVTNLCAGTYFVQMSDAAGCLRTASVNINPVNPLNVTSFLNPPGCGLANGTISVSITGGVPGYAVSWNPPVGVTATVTNIGQGSYTITVTESSPNACTLSQQINVSNTTGPTVTATQSNIKCFNDCSGSVTVTATSPFPITYNWSVGGNTPIVTNLCKGVVTVTVTSNNCSTIRSFTITDNPPIQPGVPQIVQPTCNLCNGSAILDVIGGTWPYTYTWTTGATTPSVSGLCAGLYQVDIRDAVGCTQVQNIIINNSTGITGQNFNVQGLPCNGNCVGSVSVTALGGNPPVVYTWIAPAISSSVISNLCSGDYFVQMTDAQGCIRTASVNVPAVTILNVTPTIIPPGCNQTNGSISVLISGGTPAYNINWSPVANTTPTLAGIGQGSYTITVTESGPNNCSLSQQINVSNTTGPTVTATQTDIDCFGTCTGAVSATATGVAPLTYSWSVGGNLPTANNLCNGVITLSVTDGNGCVSIRSFTINENPAIVIGVPVVTQPSCNLCNGSAAVNASGGVFPYTYTWTTGSIGNSATNLCAGLYQVDITDALGCRQTQNVILNNSNGITGESFTVQGLPCAGTCVGSITVAAVGGTAPVTYNWINPIISNSVISNLCAGAYFVQMVDAQGCIRTASTGISPVTSLSITPTIVPPGCGLPNGAISVVASGGVPAYAFSWAPVANTTATLAGITQGSYTVTVTDSGPNNCSLSQQINLNSTTGPVVVASQTDVACFNTCTGIITVTATGTAPFTYNWSVGGNSPTVSNLCKGVVTLTVTDGSNCVTIRSFTINDNPQIVLGVSQITQPTCNMCNGAAVVNAVGGTLPYTYTWTTGVSGTSVTSLCAGLYQVNVTDALGCNQTQNVIINNSNGISGESFSVQGLPCNGTCNGSASVTALGGNPPFVYNWLNPAVTSSVISNLCAGSYFVQMSDAQGCIRTASVGISAVTVLSITPTVILPGCNASNGSIILAISGGTPAYNVAWAPVANNTPTLTGLPQGSYTVTVTESGPNNCSLSQQINLSNITGPVVAATQTNVNCFGACSGVIAVNATGSGPFAYNWSVGGNTSMITNLCPGVITLSVTDANNCVTIRTFTITENTPLIVNTPQITAPSCNQCNGVATVNAFGGTIPYSYVWTTGASGQSVSNLCAGLYQVLITDNLGCQKTQNIIINNSNGITGENFSVTDETCGGNCNGSATVTAIGGTAPVTYNWINPPVSGSSISNLCGGDYFVQMTDANGCIRTASVMVNSATSLSLTPQLVLPTCGASNGSVNVVVNGGTPPYTFTWAPTGGNTSSLTGLGAGSYTVTVADNNGAGCAKTQLFTISNFNAPSITFTQTNIGCFNACTGSIVVVASGTASPFTFSWSTGGTSATVTNLCKGVVTLTVTAANGCVAIRSFTLTDNPEFELSKPNLTKPSCFGSCNGAITMIPSGGSLPYTFSWLPTGSNNPLSSLCAGTYTATITDAKGCVNTTTVLLNNPAPISVTSTPVNSSCSSIADGSISINIAGGTPAYTFTWTGPAAFTSTAQNLSNLFSGNYSLTLADNSGCRRDTVLTLVTTITITARAGRDTTICSSGGVVLTGTNSAGVSQYNWILLPGTATVATTASYVPPIAPGSSTYVLLTVSSVPGCFDRDTVVITTFPEMIVDAGPDVMIPVFSNITIGGNPTTQGAISLTWTPSFALNDGSAQNPVASNTVDITYTVTAIDANGCVLSDTMKVQLYPEVKISNGFSPNGDGKNDTWIIDYIDQFPDNTVEIYNRWGDRLFYSKGYQTPFNGQYRGKDLPVGTYYYVINLNHPAYTKPYTGPLTIFR